jgi:hypothetical protein
VFSGFRFRWEADPLTGRLGQSTERNTQAIGHIKETLNYRASKYFGRDNSCIVRTVALRKLCHKPGARTESQRNTPAATIVEPNPKIKV